MRTVLRAAHALTMDPDLGQVGDPEIVVEDGRILSVRSRSRSGHEVAATGDVDVVDLPGRVLIPGLVNAHTHVAMTLLRGYGDDLPLERWLEERIWPVERHLDADAVRVGTELGVAEMLRGGVTTASDMYLHMEAAAEVYASSGMRAVLGPAIFGGVDDPARMLEEATEVVRRWDGAEDGRIRVTLGPHSVYACPPELLRETASLARDLGVGVQIHLAETRAEVERSRERFGSSPVRVAEDTGILEVAAVAAHAVWVDRADVDLLRGAGVAVSHQARSNMKLASGIAPVLDLLDAGIEVALGTDGAASTNQLTMFEEMRAAALLQKVSTGDASGLPAGRVLEMATAGGARALGIGDTVGTLTPGKRADLVALRMDRAGTAPVHDIVSTVVYSMQDRDVDLVMCDGRVLVRDGVLAGIDEERLRAEATSTARRLTESAR